MPRETVETLGRAIKATPMNVSAGVQVITLSSETKRVSMIAVGGPARYELQVASSLVADASLGHYIAEGERIDLAVPPGPAKLSAIRASGSSATSVEVTELS